MRKIFILLVALLAVAQTLTDKEIIQQGLNGFFEANKLPDPTTIVPCLDDGTAHNMVVFMGDTLQKAAKGSITDLIGMLPDIEKFLNSIPEPVKACLNGNQQIAALGYKYGVTAETDFQVIVKKLVTYGTLHYLQVHKWFGDVNNLWQSGNYYQTGYNGAGYLHTVLGSSFQTPNPTDKEILQQGLNGLFEQNKLADPTTIVPCIDDTTAHKIVVFIGDVLEKAAKGSVSDLIALKSLIEDFGNQIPQSVKDCLDGNAEFDALGRKYGITPDTNSSALEKKIIAYVTLHYLEVHKTLGDLNTSWKAGKYYDTGFNAAVFGHKVLGSSFQTPNPTDKEILQQGLNGLFEENKLADPTTIVPCIDDATAHKIVVFIGQILEKAAKGSVSDLISLKNLIEDFGKQIPQSVKDCLDGNAELETLGKKYGITPDTNSSAIEKKVIAYVTLHYLEVHKTLGELNSDWKAGKYFQTGYTAATFGHKILGSSFQMPNPTDKEIIQQGLNGLFEVNKLADPTTIVPCFDDATAHNIVVFAGQLLDKAAKGSIADFASIVKMIQDFGDKIPQSVKDCLDGNKQLEILAAKYGITPDTDPAAIEKKVLAYVTLHYLEAHKKVGDLNSLWISGKYYQVGYDGGEYAHKILGISAEEIMNLRSE